MDMLALILIGFKWVSCIISLKGWVSRQYYVFVRLKGKSAVEKKEKKTASWCTFHVAYIIGERRKHMLCFGKQVLITSVVDRMQDMQREFESCMCLFIFLLLRLTVKDQ